jgi:actin-like ATPase involved in cell morphogenesis
MPVHIAEDPLTCVARGTGMVLEDLAVMERTLVTETYSRSPR